MHQLAANFVSLVVGAMKVGSSELVPPPSAGGDADKRQNEGSNSHSAGSEH